MKKAEIKRLVRKEVRKILTEVTEGIVSQLSRQGLVDIRPSRGAYKKPKKKK